ncbi:MAG: homoserine/homoserine lactone efflux protein [Betaproteobacteria bacterium HGW-Betaproteobacteria-7]|jgi:homoserine/homoserine lactone efflux protein|nr:MAG: homoserine/homoserine lactone efflux protein [Betaproteobacteria bacterium HGW-Betaproteobacteria-7]
MSLAVWLAFLAAAIVIAVSPGPGAVLSMSTGMRHGYRAAFIAILGLQAALLVQLSIVALGFGALLATSEMAFAILKLCGAAYLVWLGIQRWRAPPQPLAADLSVRGRGLFMQGLLVNLGNPKAIFFIGALVPQFITPSAPLLPQYLAIAATLCLTDLLVMSCYALAASHLGGWLRDPSALRLQNRLFGSLFVSAGVALAVSARN